MRAASPFQTSPTKIFNKLTRLLCADYNEEWFPLNDPTWHDKSGQPYGKVPATLDWISYDVRTAATLHSCRLLESLRRSGFVRSVLPAQQCLVAPTDVRVPSEPVQQDERQAAGRAAPRRLGLHLRTEGRPVLVSTEPNTRHRP